MTKRTRRRKSKSKRSIPSIVWARRGIILFSVIWLALFILYVAKPSPKDRPAPEVAQLTQTPKPHVQTTPHPSLVESKPVENTVSPKLTQAKKAARQPTFTEPRVAIVIDDIGNQWQSAQRLLRLPQPLTLAILPFSPFGQKIAQQAASHEKSVILHAPMEPHHAASWDGGLTLNMDQQELTSTLEAMLDWLPEAKGINNHMGSLFTSERKAMEPVLSVLAERSLYFLDSRTTAQSQGFSLAQDLAIPSAERHVFLDNERDTGLIQNQFDLLIQQAKTRGFAVGIGHPYDETLAVLEQVMSDPELAVHFVAVDAILTAYP